MIDELRAKCAAALLNGNIRFNDDNDELAVDLSEEDKQLLIEYAVSVILLESLQNFSQEVVDKQ